MVRLFVVFLFYEPVEILAAALEPHHGVGIHLKARIDDGHHVRIDTAHQHRVHPHAHPHVDRHAHAHVHPTHAHLRHGVHARQRVAVHCHRVAVQACVGGG